MEIQYVLNVTRQNFRNNNPITSFLCAKGIFDFAVNATCSNDMKKKCVLNLDYYIKI